MFICLYVYMYSLPSTDRVTHSVKFLTLARTGGIGATPLRFFADSEKMAERSAAGFWATLWGKPCAIFGKKKN